MIFVSFLLFNNNCTLKFGSYKVCNYRFLIVLVFLLFFNLCSPKPWKKKTSSQSLIYFVQLSVIEFVTENTFPYFRRIASLLLIIHYINEWPNAILILTDLQVTWFCFLWNVSFFTCVFYFSVVSFSGFHFPSPILLFIGTFNLAA